MYFQSQICLIFSICLFSRVTGQSPNVVTVNSTLPSPRMYATTIYDQDDTIYMYNGWGTSSYIDEIVKYTLSSGNVEIIGITPRETATGAGVWAGNGTMFYIDGDSSYRRTNFYKIHTSDPTNLTIISYLPYYSYYFAAAWDNHDGVYVIGGAITGGDARTIARLSISTDNSGMVAQMPTDRAHISAVTDEVGENTYIFGGASSSLLDQILHYNKSSGSVGVLAARLPLGLMNTCSVRIGNYAYIIGGETFGTKYWPYLIRFNLATYVMDSIQLNNFPTMLAGHGCTYVEKLGRIYLIGGDSYNGSWSLSDKIMYIDMNGVEF